jgi:hypothetical protein
MRPGSLLLHIKPSPDLYIDRLIILEDNKSNTPEPEPKTTAVSASVNTSTNPAFNLSKLVYPLSHKTWWDIEDNYYINGDLRLIPPLK